MRNPAIYYHAVALILFPLLGLLWTNNVDVPLATAFPTKHVHVLPGESGRRLHKNVSPLMAFGPSQPSEKEAKNAIDKVVRVLQRDKSANEELGRLQKVNNILGYGSPRAGVLAVRFNASFQKGGMGRSAVPLPFGLGQSNKSEGRGTMVGQVKASVDAETGKILEASVFRDLGYGRSFNLKV